MRLLDLDTARTARAEARGEPLHVIFGGEQFELPAELPWDFFEVLETGELKEAAGMILNGQFERFWGHQPTIEDLKAFTSGIAGLYGFADVPESSASGGSSETTGSRSRPTSPASTTSISAKRSGAQRRSG